MPKTYPAKNCDLYWCPHVQIFGDMTNRGTLVKYEQFKCQSSSCPKWEWVGVEKTVGFCNYFERREEVYPDPDW